MSKVKKKNSDKEKTKKNKNKNHSEEEIIQQAQRNNRKLWTKQRLRTRITVTYWCCVMTRTRGDAHYIHTR